MQGVNGPYVDEPDRPLCPEEEPSTVKIDHICSRECALEKKKTHKKTISGLVSSRKDISLKSSQKHLKTSKGFASFDETEEPSIGLVPLDIEQGQSQGDIKTAQLQTLYHQKLARNSSILISEGDSKLPNLFQAVKKIKNEKDQQFNFNYNGDKIPIGAGMLQKSSQINVLKTNYRLSKDRQEIRNPKKGI